VAAPLAQGIDNAAGSNNFHDRPPDLARGRVRFFLAVGVVRRFGAAIIGVCR
jgi:hypothetical protein